VDVGVMLYRGPVGAEAARASAVTER
jgi:hypothetical protein